MYGSHLVAILRTFSKKETRDLRKWLSSPAHNQRDDVVALFEYLMGGERLWQEKFLRKERIYPKLFPKTDYDDAKIRQSMHFLLKAVEEFLIHQELRGDEVRSRMALSSVYRKRKLEKAFQRTVRSLEDLQGKAPFRDEQFWRNQYLIELEKYTFNDGKKRTTEINLQEVSDALDITFLADKLRQTCLMLAHQAVYKTRYNIGLLEETLQYVEGNSLLRYPVITIYYHIYKMNTEKEKEDSIQHFQDLRNAIKEYGHLFSHAERRDIYLLAINYCVGQINRGQATMRQELFGLYRGGTEDKTLIENGELTRFTFRNIVNLGTALQELDWIQNFVEEYQQYLSPVYRESFVRFAKAKLHYARREYRPAMHIIATTDFDDILTNLHSKLMLITMYYEEEEIDALESLLDSMRAYIRRKQVKGTYEAVYTNVITYTKKLVKVNPFDKSQVEKLRREVSVAKPLPDKQWFIEKIDQL